MCANINVMAALEIAYCLFVAVDALRALITQKKVNSVQHMKENVKIDLLFKYHIKHSLGTIRFQEFDNMRML